MVIIAMFSGLLTINLEDRTLNKEDKAVIRDHCALLVPKLFADFNASLPATERRPGGFFCLLGVWQPETPILILQVGEQEREKRLNSFGFCQEKARRLAAHLGHHSSWMSRDEAARQYAGAVRCGDYAFSFSGLPELADEAMMLQLLHPEKWITTQLECLPEPHYLQHIAHLSGSHMYLSPTA